jgi:tetratricopeptide (TPR) repeat protein
MLRVIPVLVLALLIGCKAAPKPITPVPDTESSGVWERVAREHPESAIPQVYAAYAALLKEDHKAFDAALTRAKEQASDDASHKLAIGTVCLAAAKKEPAGGRRSRLLSEAVQWLSEARQADRTDTAAAFNLGMALFLQGRPSDAVPHLQDYAGRAVSDRSALRLIAQCYIEQDEIPLALQWIERPAPGSRLGAEDWEIIGRCRYLMHQFERAEEAFRRSLDLGPDRAWVWNNLGLTLQELGRTQEANECFARSRALRKRPN